MCSSGRRLLSSWCSLNSTGVSLRLNEERKEVPLVTLVLVLFFGQEGVPGAWFKKVPMEALETGV